MIAQAMKSRKVHHTGSVRCFVEAEQKGLVPCVAVCSMDRTCSPTGGNRFPVRYHCRILRPSGVSKGVSPFHVVYLSGVRPLYNRCLLLADAGDRGPSHLPLVPSYLYSWCHMTILVGYFASSVLVTSFFAVACGEARMTGEGTGLRRNGKHWGRGKGADTYQVKFGRMGVHRPHKGAHRGPLPLQRGCLARVNTGGQPLNPHNSMARVWVPWPGRRGVVSLEG